jgi:hypothetical protein
MARNINNSRSKKEKNNKSKGYTSISIIYFIIVYQFYINDNTIVFNMKWSIFLFLFCVLYIIIIIIFQFIKSINENLVKYFVSFIIAFFLSVPLYYVFKSSLSYFSKTPIELYNAKILDIREGRWRRGGKYFKVELQFKENIESIDLSKSLFDKMKNIKLSKNHARIRYRKTIFNLFIIDSIKIQSKYNQNTIKIYRRLIINMLLIY